MTVEERFAGSVSSLVVATLSLGAAVVQAQPSEVGEWRLSPSSAETAERRQAIEASLEGVPGFMRSRARGRLTARTNPPPRIAIQLSGDRLSLTRAGRTLSLTVGGPAVAVERDGERGRVQASRRKGKLVVVSRNDGGSRTTTYRLSSDGQRLVLYVSISAERLSRPLRYRVTYRRA